MEAWERFHKVECQQVKALLSIQVNFASQAISSPPSLLTYEDPEVLGFMSSKVD